MNETKDVDSLLGNNNVLYIYIFHDLALEFCVQMCC